MTTLEEVMKLRNGPYNIPLRVKVVAVDCAKTYGEGRQFMGAAIADQSRSVKAVCFDSQKFRMITEGSGLVLRNIIVKKTEIIITKQSKLYTTSAPEVSDEVTQEGKHLICPAAPECITITEAKTSPKKKRISVKGRVVNEGMTTTVNSDRQSDINIKTITIADNKEDINVTLWRDKANEEIHPGQFIKITNVVVNEYNNTVQLNTTQYSQIEVTEAPDEQLEIKIIGYMDMDDTSYELVTENGTFRIKKTLFNDNLETEDLPKTITASVNGQEIKAFN